MKVGLVLASAPGYSETFFYSKIKGLQSSGHEVILFCANNPQDFKQCTVVLFPKQYTIGLKQVSMLIWVCLGLIPYLKTLSKFISMERNEGVSWSRILKCIYNYAPIFKQKLDWLHFGFGTLAIGAENLADSKQAKMAVSFRGFDIGVYPIKYPNCYKKIWEKVSKIHVISDDIADLLYKNGFQDQAKVVKITPAIDVDYFTSPNPQNIGTPLQIITVARLHWKKGLHYTIEALALLKEKGVKFRYRIVGVGPEEEALKYATYQYGLQNEIIFLGKLNHIEIKEELAKSHLYVQYSVQEGFCNAVLEAQAMGLLCVVSKAEGLSENVLDGQSGWVVPSRRPDLLALKIINILELSENETGQIRNFAISRIKKDFNLKKQELEFMEFYLAR